MSSLWLVVWVQHFETGGGFIHPLCVCAHEAVAKHYIEYVEERLPRTELSIMELPYYG